MTKINTLACILAVLITFASPLTVPSNQTLFQQDVAWAYGLNISAGDQVYAEIICTQPPADVVIYVFEDGMKIYPAKSDGGPYVYVEDSNINTTDEFMFITSPLSGLFYILFSTSNENEFGGCGMLIVLNEELIAYDEGIVSQIGFPSPIFAFNVT